MFVAMSPSAEALAACASLLEPLRRGQDDTRTVRWVDARALHVTLKFLGDTDVGRIDTVVSATQAAVGSLRPFTVTLAEAGVFPSRSRPRVLWVGVADGAEELRRLAAAIDELLGREGWPREDRPFRAHVTVGRADGSPAAGAAASRLVAAATGWQTAFDASAVTIFRSELGSGPARYTELGRAQLGG
ncbi:MAG: RNA 2',3'-cyclic phosphodiesterase [Chloroflexota bacterium]